MKKLGLLWIILGLAFTLCLSCGGDDNDSSTDTGSDTTPGDSSSDSASDSGEDTVEEVVALDMKFEDGLGGGAKFFMSAPDGEKAEIESTGTDATDTATDTATNAVTDTATDTVADTETDTATDTAADTATTDTETGSDITVDTATAEEFEGFIYADNNTATEIAGQNALILHAGGVQDNNNGYSVEFQMQLDEQTDMTRGDFKLSFDIYIPQATYDLGANVQFAFFETSNYTPIYSKWYNVVPEKWITINADIQYEDDTIDYTTFENNPGDWIFDVVRIKVICNDASAVEGSEILYYVDNILVTNK